MRVAGVVRDPVRRLVREPRSSTDPPRRLWIVDDVTLELEASRRAMETHYEVELFSDGSSVLERATDGRDLPDALLLDWHMEGVSGLEVVRFLRANPSTEGLPIVVFTASGDGDGVLEALAAGADDYVVKLCSAAELDARVRTLIRSKGLRERVEQAERELAVLLDREREARAGAEAANRQKDQFIATISHELRSPLQAILGWARILAAAAGDADKVRQAATVIERNARSQARIIDDLLDVSRIVAGKLHLDLATIEVADAIELALDSVRPSAASKGVELVAHLDRGCAIAGDAVRLQQIVWNLLTNAVKFTPRGGRIEVHLGVGVGRVTLRVADSGPGIAASLLPQVFDRFRQGDAASTGAHGGLGLGLAIVRQLVELHDGRVTASNAASGGAVFEVVFPSILADSSVNVPPPELPAQVARPADALAGLALLLVDDDPDAREALRLMLTDRGAVVRDAGTAAGALALLETGVPDVIVSDISMPEQDGYALMRTIRERHPTGLPGVALTSLAGDADRADSRAAGFELHLVKPVDADELVRAILECGPARRHGHLGPT